MKFETPVGPIKFICQGPHEQPVEAHTALVEPGKDEADVLCDACLEARAKHDVCLRAWSGLSAAQRSGTTFHAWDAHLDSQQ